MPVDLVVQSDGVAIVTLSNPGKHNALDETMFRSLSSLWRELASSPARCVVLRGAEGAFCSGADLTGDLARLPDIDDLIESALLKTAFFPKPLIAAIEGACVAGGLELALSCDARICSDSARFGLPEARWGIYPAGGGALKLAGQIGYAKAHELLLSGRLFDAQQALDMGLVSNMVPSSSLWEVAMALARAIAANSPAAILAIKRYLHAAASPSEELLRLDRELTRSTRRSADAKEGRSAFLEKRIPQYKAL